MTFSNYALSFPHEQFQIAVIATGYVTMPTAPNQPHEMLSTLQKIRNGPSFVKVIAAEERASHAFILP